MATDLVAAVAMCKDEADIVEASLRRMAHQVDFVIVADNGSTDGTSEILGRLAHELPLTVIEDPEVGYYQSQKMTGLARRAAAYGAGWVVAFDIDEVWLPRPHGRIKTQLAALDQAVLVAEAPLFDHVATAQDPADEDPIRRIGWRRPDAAPLRKVAVRPRKDLTIHQGNHGATFARVLHPPTVTSALEVRHFPYRSVAQFVSKVRNGAAAYAATDLPEDVGGHWRSYGRILDEHGEQGIADVFHRWFWRDRPAEPLTIGSERQPPLVHDPV